MVTYLGWNKFRSVRNRKGTQNKNRKHKNWSKAGPNPGCSM